MPNPDREWLEARIVAHLERVSAGTDLTVEMVRRSREQLAKSWDILRAAEVPKPDTFLGRQHYELMGGRRSDGRAATG